MNTTNHARDTPSEKRSEAIVRRLRGQLAENRISGTELAKRLGTTQALISRRLAGTVPFDIDELDAIERVTGISADYLWSGRREND